MLEKRKLHYSRYFHEFAPPTYPASTDRFYAELKMGCGFFSVLANGEKEERAEVGGARRRGYFAKIARTV